MWVDAPMYHSGGERIYGWLNDTHSGFYAATICRTGIDISLDLFNGFGVPTTRTLFPTIEAAKLAYEAMR